MPATNMTFTAQYREKASVTIDESNQSYTYDGTVKSFEIKGTDLDGFTVTYCKYSTNEAVADGEWYTEAIRWAAYAGIVNGYSAEIFAPSDPITREQLAAILYRYEQYKGDGFAEEWAFPMDYVDISDVSEWAYEAMCRMSKNGIVNGKSGKILDPKGNATRAEAATMLYRYCEVSDKDKEN